MSQNYLSPAERRAMTILDAYGSRPAHWPAEERQATLECITRSQNLQHYQAQLEDLDARIESAQAISLPSSHTIQALQQRILAGLPEKTAATGATRYYHFLNWLMTPRYAMAFTAITILAIVLAMPHSSTMVTNRYANNNAYATWSWYDITGQDLSPAKQTTTALTMTDFIDLEINQDGS